MLLVQIIRFDSSLTMLMLLLLICIALLLQRDQPAVRFGFLQLHIVSFRSISRKAILLRARLDIDGEPRCLGTIGGEEHSHRIVIHCPFLIPLAQHAFARAAVCRRRDAAGAPGPMGDVQALGSSGTPRPNVFAVRRRRSAGGGR